MEYDNLHWDFREVDGYDLPFNFIVSEREAGKSTSAWRKNKINFENGCTFLLTRQQKVSLSDIYINDCSKLMNKFINKETERYDFLFSKSALEKGIVDVYAQKRKKGSKARIMFRAVALSNSMSDTKSLFLPKCKYHFADEFIKNTREGEYYLKGEVFRYKELINTFQRESGGKFKSYQFGNPYSRANPYFVEFGVDISKLKRGSIYVDRERGVLVQCYEIKPELREKIRETNPLYKFSDEYTKYAFDGMAINDMHMAIVQKQPKNFRLMLAVRIDGHIVGIYQTQNFMSFDFVYWIGPTSELGASRLVYAFDFKDLQHNAILIDKYGRHLLGDFAAAMRTRKVAFANSQYGTWAEEIYNYL